MRGVIELFKYKSLIMALVGRHLASRYRGSALGMLWSFLNPLFFMLIYVLVFKYYIRFDSVQNYSIFLFCGLLPWVWFNSGLIEATNSIVSSGHLITKSMFPPEILPAVSVITNLVHYLLSLILLFGFMIYFEVAFTATLLLMPVLILLQTIMMYSIGLMFSALNVFYRDIQHLLANALNLLFFLCPILYPPSTVPEQFQFTITLNPIALLISMYHSVILEATVPDMTSWVFVISFTILMFVIGNNVFNKHRETFAESL